MAEWLIVPLEYGFFVRGLVAGLIVAMACGMLSAFIVWRGMAFIGDALAHAVLPGIVISVILGIHLLFGALAAAFVSVFAIGSISGRRGLRDDTAIGVIFTGAFALGILLMNKVSSFQDLSHVLFGSILGVAKTDLVVIAVIAAVVAAAVFLFYKELLVTSFDPIHAIAIGLSPGLIHYGLLILVAATTVIATQTVGVVLVLALLVTPAATASLLAKKLPWIIGLSVVIAQMSVVTGFYASYYLDLASGAAVVIILTLMFLSAFSWSQLRKWAVRAR